MVKRRFYRSNYLNRTVMVDGERWRFVRPTFEQLRTLGQDGEEWFFQWSRFYRKLAELVGLEDEAGRLRFLWGGRHPILKIDGGPFYRPGSLECRPSDRKCACGTSQVALVGIEAICARSVESQTNGVAVQAMIDRCGFFARCGAMHRIFPDWPAEDGCRTMHIAESKTLWFGSQFDERLEAS